MVEGLVEYWRQFGLPGYAQFDNDTVFQGPHAHPDVIGRVSRLCLGLGIVPVFLPPREPDFQAAIEQYNGSWQVRVWGRFEHADLDALSDRSRRHVAALRRYRADRIEAAPPRSAFPRRWRLDLQARLKGRMVCMPVSDVVAVATVLLFDRSGGCGTWPITGCSEQFVTSPRTSGPVHRRRRASGTDTPGPR